MRLPTLGGLLALTTLSTSTIFENGQIRSNPYPGQPTLLPSPPPPQTWQTFPPSSPAIAYKGRWDANHISWWSVPGLKLRFTGANLALAFGAYTSPGVLLAWRLDGQDWQFANVTANATYQFISADTTGANLTAPGAPQTFEMRVTNWAYGVQLAGVLLCPGESLLKIPSYAKNVEIIGDSLSSGYSATYEGISSWAWGFVNTLGDVEYSITAYPGICLSDHLCYGNARGQVYQWKQTSDTSYRATQIYGTKPIPWDFETHQQADMVVINIGTNDNSNNFTSEYTASYIKLIDDVHATWPHARVIIMSLWIGFGPSGNTYVQATQLRENQNAVYAHFQQTYRHKNFVSLFNTTGILQHNDMNPAYHPTDVGHIKVASSLLQYVKDVFGWQSTATGPEVYSHTLYWNDMTAY